MFFAQQIPQKSKNLERARDRDIQSLIHQYSRFYFEFKYFCKIMAFIRRLVLKSNVFSFEQRARRFNERWINTLRPFHQNGKSVNDWNSHAHKYGHKFRQAYDAAKSYLDEMQVPSSAESARYLLCDVAGTGYRMSDFNKAMDAHSKVSLSTEQMARLGSHCMLRARRMPVQYIIGNWDFYGLVLQCKPPVLIPRSETEELVEHIIASNILLVPSGKARILDIGIGTGAVGLAIMANQPRVSCLGLDVSKEAVELASLNSTTVLAPLMSAGLVGKYESRLQSFQDFVASGEGSGIFDVIVSNPPYITSDEMETLQPEVANYEDSRALHGGDDGLALIREIILNARSLLSSDGPGELWMEVAPQHPAKIEEWLRTLQQSGNCPGMAFIAGIADSSDRPRFVRLRRV